MSKLIRTALDRLCSDRELIKKSYAELEELERKATAYDNAKDDLELAQAVKYLLSEQGVITDMEVEGVGYCVWNTPQELIEWYREQKESASNATKQEKNVEVASCFECVHYRQSQVENECKATGDYCYPAHNVTECEYFERA